MKEHDITSENDFETDIMTLVDDEGIEHEFEIADTLELDGENYVALIPIFKNVEDSLEDPAELVILKIVAGEGEGEEFLEAIEDEDEFEKIGAIFVERLESEYEFEDAE